MLKFLPYVRKNVLGHRVRTGMTVAGTAVLMFLFLFVSAVQAGLDRLLDSRGDVLVVYQAYRLCPSSSQLPVFYDDAIRGVPGVKDVLPVKVVVNNCRASLDTVVFHGVDPQRLPRARTDFRFLAGDWAAFQGRADAALVGRRLAERRGLKAGQPLTAAGVTVQVAGVFASDSPGEENLAYVHLPVLLNAKEHGELHVTLFEVTVADPHQADAVAAAIDAKVKDRFQVPTETKPQSAHARTALADLLDLIGMTRWLGVVCVGVVLVLVANSVVMAAQDRVKEHAVLQTIGYSGPRIAGLMLAESGLLSLAGGVLGVVGCVAWLAWQPLSLSAEGVSVDFVASPGLVGWGLGLSAVVGVLAGAVPAWQAGRAEIVASLRPGRRTNFGCVMRLLPWDYGVRNLARRPLRTGLTALGLTLVVFLLLLAVGFVRGLEESLRQTGDPEVVVLHNANAAENLDNSSVGDEVAALARTEFAAHLVRYGDAAAVSPELTVASRVAAPRAEANTQIGVLRGVDFDRVFLVRRQVALVEGKLPGPGEVLVGRLVPAKLGLHAADVAVGSKLVIEGRPWTVSGRFAAPGTLLEAEVWCPLDELKVATKRTADVSVVAMRFDPAGDPAKQMGFVDYFCRNRRPDLELMGTREAEYYGTLRRHYGPVRTLAWVLAALVGLAGACGAVNTMYAAVAGRVREFAALQAVGFPRRAIAVSLLQESVILAAAATLAAAALAVLTLHGAAIRFTMGAFTLQLDRVALLVGCGAGLALGVFGAVPPAVRAFRMTIVDALKAV